MPRQADPELETRVLTAAQKLWAKGGQKSLTMRAVARAAGTNTPAVYRRFKDRRDLLRALLRRTQAELAAGFHQCNSLQEICTFLFDYAMSHPREYELVASRLVITSNRKRPNFEFVIEKAGEWLGGPAEDYRPLVIALWSVVHGSAMLLINGVIPESAAAVRSALVVAVEELVRSPRGFAKLRK